MVGKSNNSPTVGASPKVAFVHPHYNLGFLVRKVDRLRGGSKRRAESVEGRYYRIHLSEKVKRAAKSVEGMYRVAELRVIRADPDVRSPDRKTNNRLILAAFG